MKTLTQTSPNWLPEQAAAPLASGVFVNDIHSQLNRTRVSRIVKPRNIKDLQETIRGARARGEKIATAGGWHSMGGQQFANDAVLLDMADMAQVVDFDAERGLIEVEAGIQWPALAQYLVAAQTGRAAQFGIIQKQTGADRLSLGGALSSNIHGRGLALKPFIADVEAFVLLDAEGVARRCSREENADLFRLASGGYGLFGVIARVTLRLAPRRKVERVVSIASLPDLPGLFSQRIADGFLYGDFQFAIARESDDFLRRGVFSCYRPAASETLLTEQPKELSFQDWEDLLWLAHVDRQRAFELYAAHYLATDGQVYWSDTHQLSVYVDDYHRCLDARLPEHLRGSEMITELYVPRAALLDFLNEVREDFRRQQTELIYGTIRLIERDDESFLAWAREDFACVVFNLHVTHTAAGQGRAAAEFRRLIDRAIEFGGSFYLTYHRWATREQVLDCYPQMPEFLRLKRLYDPTELFQSNWYRHYRPMFA